ncbi:uncharacterized protein E0L32_005084 [Thyridium curvatum]|uniref:Dehydrogenase FUB6 n=1 Tax=Thyridium curvatum TaxID=1093900 RepID=A0A507BBE0_9PEZI|nr:uncharacterized protein E0L32_005084 [Thyridium curvatum]TPX14689.1 hypothetical protein E0L32_005084 [Thyridium curvatum]
MSRQNTSIVLAERPEGDIVPGKTFAVKTGPAPTEADLKDGQILVEVLYLSLDPTMRSYLKEGRSYLPPVQIGEVMRGPSACRVLASRSPKARAGDLVHAYPGWTEVGIVGERWFERVELPPSARVTDICGVLGVTGLTAYYGMTKIADLKQGDTVVVSGAAGATGSIVGQIARIMGAGRLVGIAGTDDKCRWLREELGYDVALNYKDPDFKNQFYEATKGYIDVYWDNVGGEILDLALAQAKEHARFVMCGGISQYNAKVPQGPKNYLKIVTMRIKMQGFIVLDYMKENAAAQKQLAQWLTEGKLKRQETIVKGGVRVAEETLVGLYNGINTGKLLVEVKNPDEASKL